MRKSVVVSGVCVALAFCLSPHAGRAQSEKIKLLITETDYGKRVDIMEGEEFVFSPDRKRLAYWAYEPRKRPYDPNGPAEYRDVQVVINGVPGKIYDYVYYDNPRASNRTSGDVIFSPDSQHFAYRALQGTSWMVVRDGKEDKPFIKKVRDGVWEYYQERGADVIDDIVWSADSRHLAYRAIRSNKWRVVLDGKEGRRYDWIADDDLHFSADGKRLAFWAKRGKRNLLVMMAGRKVTETPFVPRPKIKIVKDASPPVSDFYLGKPEWNIVKRGDKKALLCKTREGKPYDDIFSPVVSPGNRHIAYWAEANGKWRIVVDDVEGKSYRNGASADEPFTGDADYDPNYVAPNHHLDPLVFDGDKSLHTMALRFDGHIAHVRVDIVEE